MESPKPRAQGAPLTHDQAPVGAVALGYGGVLPFLGLALNTLLGGPLPSAFALHAFLVYAAAILSFLGGIRWGAALKLDRARSRELSLAVLPSLWAAGALLLPHPGWSVWALLAGFVLTLIGDLAVPWPTVPGWMKRLRIQLTAAVMACHLIMLGALTR